MNKDKIDDMVARWLVWIPIGFILLALGSRGWGF